MLNDVAKPWIDGSPAPLTSHSDAGEPGRQFSATTGLAGDVHGPSADARPCKGGNPRTASPRTAAITRRNTKPRGAISHPHQTQRLATSKHLSESGAADFGDTTSSRPRERR